MTNDRDDLLGWALARRKGGRKNRDLSRITFGQMLILLELTDRGSVAECSGGDPKADVNRHQKLARLKSSLGSDAITRLVGNRVQLSPEGQVITREFKHLLAAIRSVEGLQPEVIRIAAGDTWVQSILIPSVWEVKSATPKLRWNVRNIDEGQIAAEVINREVHFGLIRKSSYKEEWKPDAAVLGSWEIKSHAILVGDKVPLLAKDGRRVLRELIARQVPWIQPDRTRRQVAEACAAVLGKPFTLQPEIECGTHLQAAFSILNRKAWCVVPSQIANTIERTLGGGSSVMPGYQRFEMSQFCEKDEVVLIHNPRVTDNIPIMGEVGEKLRRAIGHKIRA